VETLETLLNIRTDEAELPVPMVHASDMNSESVVGTSTAEAFPLSSRNAKARSSLHDPRGYIEIIPWVELDPVSPAVLEEAQIPIFLPHRTFMAQEALDVKWMLWKPPSSNFFDCHHCAIISLRRMRSINTVSKTTGIFLANFMVTAWSLHYSLSKPVDLSMTWKISGIPGYVSSEYRFALFHECNISNV
jgi:hypothetical protein